MIYVSHDEAIKFLRHRIENLQDHIKVMEEAISRFSNVNSANNEEVIESFYDHKDKAALIAEIVEEVLTLK